MKGSGSGVLEGPHVWKATCIGIGLSVCLYPLACLFTCVKVFMHVFIVCN